MAQMVKYRESKAACKSAPAAGGERVKRPIIIDPAFGLTGNSASREIYRVADSKVVVPVPRPRDQLALSMYLQFLIIIIIVNILATL